MQKYIPDAEMPTLSLSCHAYVVHTYANLETVMCCKYLHQSRPPKQGPLKRSLPEGSFCAKAASGNNFGRPNGIFEIDCGSHFRPGWFHHFSPEILWGAAWTSSCSQGAPEEQTCHQNAIPGPKHIFSCRIDEDSFNLSIMCIRKL